MLRAEEFAFTSRHAVTLGDKGSGRNAFYPPSLEFWILVPFYSFLSSSLSLSCLFSLLLPQERRIMLFRFAYMSRPFLPPASPIQLYIP